MKEITIKLTDKEYSQYVKKGHSEYHMLIKKAIEDEEYVRWRVIVYIVGAILIVNYFPH